MPKLAFLTHIFSDKALGGAERLVFEFSNLLSKDLEIDIITTTAIDYKTWKNEYLPGVYPKENGKIYRFSVKKKRSLFFNYINKKAIQKQNLLSDLEFEKWLIAQGPYVPELVEYVKENHTKYDLFFCFTYLYYPIVKSIPYFHEKTVCILTLHDEKVAYFPQFKKIYTEDLYYCFNVPKELEVYKKIFNFTPNRFKVVGMNISVSQNVSSYVHTSPYILYVGRIDEGKGILELIQSFLQWKENFQSNWELILIGGGKLGIKSPYIHHLGFVSEQKKYELIQGAELIVNPSQFESFSIVIMEAWLFKKAVLVNGNSEVLREHCILSNAGLFYSDTESFIACLEFFYKNPLTSSKMGENGKEYVKKNYNKDIIKKKLLEVVHEKLNASNRQFL